MRICKWNISIKTIEQSGVGDHKSLDGSAVACYYGYSN